MPLGYLSKRQRRLFAHSQLFPVNTSSLVFIHHQKNMSSISTLEQQLTSLMGDLLTQTTTTEAHWRDRIDQFIERRKAEKLAQLEANSHIDKLTNKADHQRRPKANLFLRELLAQGQQKMLAEIFSCDYADEKTERLLILSPEVLLAEMTAGLQQAAKFEEEKKLSTSSDGSGSISGGSSGHGTAQD